GGSALPAARTAGSLVPTLLAGVFVPAAVLEEGGAIVQANLDLHAIHVESGAGLDLRSGLAGEVTVFKTLDFRRAGRDIPCLSVGQARLHDQCKSVGEDVGVFGLGR